jgi:hypothetical protein
MAKRYFELREFLPEALRLFPELEEYFLSISEENTLKNINETMKNFADVTFALQNKDFTLGEMRVLFDGVIEKYPTMNKYLAVDAKIIHHPNFERGLLTNIP